MSSDNWLHVGKRTDGKFAIVHQMGDGAEESKLQELLDQSPVVFDDLPTTVIRAHRRAVAEYVEYGVHVDPEIVEDWLKTNE